MRLFIAINLPDSVRPELFQAAAPLHRAAPAVRWVQPETLHITLKFLGEVPDQRLSSIVQALRSTASAATGFPLHLGGVGAFPNLRRARVIWLGAGGGSALLNLQTNLDAELEPLGYPREARPFHPHVTLGRVGPHLTPEELRRAERAAVEVEYETTVAVRSVELMQSRLSPSGARYDVVQRVPLPDQS